MENTLQVMNFHPHPNPLPVSRAREIKENVTCEECFKIKCRGCGWEPNPKQLALVQNGTLTVGPDCGWSPTENLEL